MLAGVETGIPCQVGFSIGLLETRQLVIFRGRRRRRERGSGEAEREEEEEEEGGEGVPKVEATVFFLN